MLVLDGASCVTGQTRVVDNGFSLIEGAAWRWG
jgi:hypothetical protein